MKEGILNLLYSIGWIRYIAKTFYGDEEDDESQQTSFTMDEPRLIGVYPSSGEKVRSWSLY